MVSIVNWAKGIDVSPKVLWLADGTVKMEVEEHQENEPLLIATKRAVECTALTQTGKQGVI